MYDPIPAHEESHRAAEELAAQKYEERAQYFRSCFNEAISTIEPYATLDCCALREVYAPSLLGIRTRPYIQERPALYRRVAECIEIMPESGLSDLVGLLIRASDGQNVQESARALILQIREVFVIDEMEPPL